jgi:uncharacterized protein with HEPN domain
MKRPHPERVEDYLGHIAEAITRATGYVQPLPNIEAFEKNPQVQDAVVRNIEIIGEAVRHITRTAPGFTDQHPSFHGHRCAQCTMSAFTNILPWT